MNILLHLCFLYNIIRRWEDDFQDFLKCCIIYIFKKKYTFRFVISMVNLEVVSDICPISFNRPNTGGGIVVSSN